MDKHFRRRFEVVGLAVLVVASTAHADGCIYGKGGRLVPEKEQQAFIEWNAGQERLWIATRSEPADGPTVWIVPIPAVPAQVKAEPVAVIPTVIYTRTPTDSAWVILEDTAVWTLAADSGFLPLIVPRLFGGGDSKPRGVEVHDHVEKLGLVVELLTAESTQALDEYLASKDLKVPRANLSALEAYLRPGYTLICGWRAAADAEITARAVRIDFRSDKVFFPLRPTSVYETDIQTAIYVRGWFQPSASSTAPACEWLIGHVEDLSAATATIVHQRHWQPDGPLRHEPITRVILGKRPREWRDDLSMEIGAPWAMQLAGLIDPLGYHTAWLLPMAVGMVLGTLAPWLLLTKANRRPVDWLWCIGLGGSICLTIYGLAAMFYVWCLCRHPWGPPKRLGSQIRIAASVAAVVAPLFLLGLVGVFVFEKHVFFGLVALCAVPLMVALPFAGIGLAWSAAGRRAFWLLAFAAIHALAVGGICEALRMAMGPYY